MKADDRKRYQLEDSLAHLTARFYRSIMKQINKALCDEGLNITLEQWPILIHVWDHNGVSQNDLAKKLFKDKTTIARLVAGIEALGMIARVPSPDDGRGKQIYLTAKGKTMMGKATAIVQKIDDLAAAGIDEEYVRICKDVLRMVHKKLA